MLTLSATKRKHSLADYVNVTVTVDTASPMSLFSDVSVMTATGYGSPMDTLLKETFTRELERLQRELYASVALPSRILFGDIE